VPVGSRLQGDDDLRLARDRRVAADEEQPKLIVFDLVFEVT